MRSAAPVPRAEAPAAAGGFTVTGRAAGPGAGHHARHPSRRGPPTIVSGSSIEEDNVNGITSGGRNRHRRAGAGILATALSGIAVLAAACAGGPAAGASSGAGQAPYQQALAYAQCMRSHGLPRFPDPDSQGQFQLTGPEVGPFNSPQYLSADNACGHLLPKSAPMSQARKRENISQALKYSGCMRAHGITSFPDPVVSNGGAGVGFRVGRIDQNSPQFQAAAQACREFEPGLAGPLAGGGTP
jgi:hypothetical protein